MKHVWGVLALRWKHIVDGDENGLNLTILMPILMRTMIVQNLDGWKLRRRKQSEDAIVRVSEIKRVADQEQENGGRRKS